MVSTSIAEVPGSRVPSRGLAPASQQPRVLAGLANNVLRLIVLPTEACNFRCTYCYEEFEQGRMHRDVVGGLKKFMDRRAAELDALTVSWFGGEPLLARDIVEDVMSHAQRLAARRPALRVRSDMTTNGSMLDRPVFERLLELGVRQYQVSLDGPRAWHDATRVTAAGRGTFDHLWDHLRTMQSVRDEFEIVLRVHVHAGNRNALPRLLEQLAQQFGSDERFRVALKELSALGGPCDSRFPYLQKAAARTTIDALEQRIDALGLQRLRRPTGVCYAGQGNAFVVRADGRINKCTVALEHPANQVGHLRPDGRLQLRGERMAGWMRGVVSGDAEELRCPMRGLADSAPVGAVQVRMAS